MRLLPSNGQIIGGRILFGGHDLVKLPVEEMRKIRLKKISMIFQSSLNAFDPVQRVGDQLIEALRTHERISQGEARRRVEELFDLVGLSPLRMKNYPHEFSGGMNQRALIAMSLLCNPEIIIADEPTTALDVVMQDRVLQEIRNLQSKLNIAMIIITHDISVVAETCNKIAVMYGGEIVELANTESIFKDPHHPYTIGLLQSFPNIRGPMSKLLSIPGAPPSLLDPTPSCRFKPRCPRAEKVCEKRPPSIRVAEDHFSLCHFALDPSLNRIGFVES
jgi:peptide/nickel transport system ATP-binding protein